jgi:hypothetical protein
MSNTSMSTGDILTKRDVAELLQVSDRTVPKPLADVKAGRAEIAHARKKSMTCLRGRELS